MLNKKAVFCLLLFVMIVVVACINAGGSEPAMNESDESMQEMDHDNENMDHEAEEMDHDHEDHADDRIPNPGGAAIRIIAPAEGDEFDEGDQIIVDVEVENFTLGEDGNHWHVYVDGESFGMVVGGNTDQPLTGVEPGDREISVYLANGDHEEFIEGDTVTVVVR